MPIFCNNKNNIEEMEWNVEAWDRVAARSEDAILRHRGPAATAANRGVGAIRTPMGKSQCNIVAPLNDVSKPLKRGISLVENAFSRAENRASCSIFHLDSLIPSLIQHSYVL